MSSDGFVDFSALKTGLNPALGKRGYHWFMWPERNPTFKQPEKTDVHMEDRLE